MNAIDEAIQARAEKAAAVYQDAIDRGCSATDAAYLADIEAGVRRAPEGTLFPIECAWCRRERGVQQIVGWSPVPNSHGICDRHFKELTNGRE